MVWAQEDIFSVGYITEHLYTARYNLQERNIKEYTKIEGDISELSSCVSERKKVLVLKYYSGP